MADLKAFAEQLVNLTVKEVNELATILKEEYGIEPAAAAVAVAAGPAAGAAEAAEEKTSFGATIGMLAGLFMGPMGLLLGPFVCAVLGEMSVNRDDSAKAIRVGFGAFLSFIVGTGIKMIASIAMLIYIIGDMGGIFMGWGDSLGAWWTTVVEWFTQLFS